MPHTARRNRSGQRLEHARSVHPQGSAVMALTDTIPAPTMPQPGQTVTLNIPGAWHHGRCGVIVDIYGEIVTVRYVGHGTVTAPLGVVAALPARYL